MLSQVAFQLDLIQVVIEELEFSPLERKIYDSIFHSAKRNFEQLDAKGLVGKNYTHILAMLMRYVFQAQLADRVGLIVFRLRRAVLHPSLVLIKNDECALPAGGDGRVDLNDLIKGFAEGTQSNQSSNAFTEEFMANLKGEGLAECPICFSEMESPMVIPQCMHQLYVLPLLTHFQCCSFYESCKDCIVSHIGICKERKQKPNCPTCNCGPIEVCRNFLQLLQSNIYFNHNQRVPTWQR